MPRRDRTAPPSVPSDEFNTQQNKMQQLATKSLTPHRETRWPGTFPRHHSTPPACLMSLSPPRVRPGCPPWRPPHTPDPRSVPTDARSSKGHRKRGGLYPRPSGTADVLLCLTSDQTARHPSCVLPVRALGSNTNREKMRSHRVPRKAKGLERIQGSGRHP